MAIPNDVVIDQVDLSPFDGLHISNDKVLTGLKGRHPCPRCGKSRKYFCYSCYVPIKELDGSLPRVRLPIKIDIIKHRREIDGKSTSGHAAIIAPDDVKVYTYPDIPSYDKNNTVLIYPSSSAVEVYKLFERNFEYCIGTKAENRIQLPKGFNATTLMKRSSTDVQNVVIGIGNVKALPVTKAVFIDSTWNQSNGIYKDERLKKLQCVILQNRTSQFWRHQKGSPRWYLATVEAIHQFALEMHLCVWGVRPEYEGLSRCFRQNVLECFNNFNIKNEGTNAYFGQYDDLLFFFKHFYCLIHDYYDHNELCAYKRRLE